MSPTAGGGPFSDGRLRAVFPLASAKERRDAQGLEVLTTRVASTVVVVLGGPLGPADVPRLCERLRGMVEGRDAGLLVCDVGALRCVDLGTVDALARLWLVALRLGWSFQLRAASPGLRELLDLVGVADVLPEECGPDQCRARDRAEGAGRTAGTASRYPGRS